MKKYLLLASTLLAFTASAGENMEVKPEGSFDFQVGARKQKKLGNDNHLTDNQKNMAFFTQGNLKVDVSNTTDEGMKYGAAIVVRTTSRQKVFGGINGSHLYMETDNGKLELGSRQNAPSTMSMSAYNIATATGDDWGRYVNLNPAVYTFVGSMDKQGLYNGDVTFYDPIYSGFGSGETSGAEQVRTATYYTPEFNGLQLGFSYSPDTANTGDNSNLKDAKGATQHQFYDKTDGYAPVAAKVAVKDLIGAGVTYSHNLSDGLDIKVGAGLEQGKAVAKNIDSGDNLKLTNHKLYNVGAVVSYGNWAFAGSYANAGKSLTSTKYHYDSRANKHYTGGVAYNQGPMGVSLIYLHNDKLKNRMDAYTLGTQYKLAPGLMPYFEVTSFKVKSRGYDMSDSGKAVATNKNIKGMTYMFGTKVSF